MMLPRSQVAILAGALVLRLWVCSGPASADEFAYLEHALDWVDGRYNPAQTHYVYGLRYGLVLPLAGAMKLFGRSPLATTLPSIIADMLGVLCVMVVARKLATRTIALLAGGIIALNPLSIISASRILPEAFFNVALWAPLAVLATDTDNADGHGSARCFWAGLIGGYSYTVRPYGPVLVALAALPFLSPRGRPNRNTAVFAAGLALIPVAEAMFHLARTGNPLYTMQVNAAAYKDVLNLENSLLYYPTQLVNFHSELGLLPIAVLTAIPFAWRAGRVARLSLFWLAVWFGFLEFAIMAWNPIILIQKELRYLSILLLPGSLLVAAVLHRSWTEWGTTRRIGLAVLCTVFVTSDLLYVSRSSRALSLSTVRYREVGDAILMGHPDGVAFPHFRWPLRVNYFTHYVDGYRTHAPSHPPMRFRVPSATATPRPGEWILVDPTLFTPGGDWPHSHDPLPMWMVAPPRSWKVVFRSGPVQIVEAPRDPSAEGQSRPN